MTEWTAREPGRARLRRELLRLWIRATSRPLATLALTALMSAAVVYMYARRPPMFSARVVLSMREGKIDEAASSPQAKLELRSYIADAALNRQNLWTVIEKHDLFPRLRQLDPSFAIDKLWDTLDIDVYRNEFAELRQERLRSARIAVRFAFGDPITAELVADDVADMIVDFEARKRRASATLAVAHMNRVAQDAEQQIERRTSELSEKRRLFDSDRAEDPERLGVEIARLERTLESARGRLKLVQEAKASIEFKASLEARQLALQFSVVDRERPVAVPRPVSLLIALAVAAFALCLVPAGIAVGAFDSRIYNREDIERLGMPVLGHVPGFRSTQLGSMARRRRKSR